MNTKRIIRVTMIAVIAAGAIFSVQKIASKAGQNIQAKALYYCPMHPTYTSDKPGNCPICNMKLVKRETPAEQTAVDQSANSTSKSPLREFSVKEIMAMKPGELCLLHKCKMGHCQFVMTEEFARLGKCPHCGEDLGIIVKDALPKGYGSVQIATEKQQMIGIQTVRAEKTTLVKSIRTVGKIAYDPELYQAEEEFIQAAQAMKKTETGNVEEIKEQASKLVDSSKIKLKLMGLSDDLIQEIAETGKPDRTLLYSEAGGKVWLYVPIYEYEIPYVKAGESVEAEASAIPGKKFEGVIRAVDSVLDPVTRSIRVRAVLENAEGLLKPEMYVNATLQIHVGNVLTVPNEAVFSTGDKNIVFVAKENGIFEPRDVMLGVKTDTAVEIKSGIQEGESVVTSGNFLIDSESQLKAALHGISEGDHQHGG